MPGPDNALVDGRAGLDLLIRPDLDARVDRGALTGDDVIADDSAFLQQAIVLDGDVPADDGLAQPRILADIGIGPDDGVADLRVLVDHGKVADAHRPVDEDPRLELAIVADVRRTVDPDVVADFDVFTDPDATVATLARDLDVDPTFERIPVRLVVGLNVSDVAPVARRQVAVQRHLVGQHLGKDLAAPIHHRGGRQQIEDLGLDHIDAGVDLVGKHFAPGRLLEKAVDGPIGIGDHHPVLEWVRHRGEDDRRGCALLLVVGHHLAQVDIGEGVATDHDEGLVEVFLGVLDTAGGAQWRILDHIGDVDAEV